jgi:hypothetical protein
METVKFGILNFGISKNFESFKIMGVLKFWTLRNFGNFENFELLQILKFEEFQFPQFLKSEKLKIVEFWEFWGCSLFEMKLMRF